MLVTLQSNDGQLFTVNEKAVEKCGTIKEMRNVLVPSSDPIPLANVNSAVLQKVLEWCAYYQDDPESVDDLEDYRMRSTILSEWDNAYFDVDIVRLLEILEAADYLDIPSLLNAGSLKVANLIQGKTPEEIRELFNLENDFSEEEKEKIRKENEWKENH